MQRGVRNALRVKRGKYVFAKVIVQSMSLLKELKTMTLFLPTLFNIDIRVTEIPE